MRGKEIHLVYTDLDGTLLDHYTYSYRAALPGIDLLKKNRIPLILVSSKTFPEMKDLHRALDIPYPFIFENGGGIAFPDAESPDYGYRLRIMGRPAAELMEMLPLLTDTLKSQIKTMAEMEAGEIAALTGLTPEEAALSRQRKASMPFVILSDKRPGTGDMQRINRELETHGLMITRGGRFYHVSGLEADKGTAADTITRMYREKFGRKEIRTVGIGDSENDIPLLRKVTFPVLVRRPDNTVIESGLDAMTTGEIGPAGFTEAVRFFIPGQGPA